MALTDWLPFLRRPAPVLEERAVVDRTPIGMPPGGAQAYISNYADTGRSITPEQARESPTVYACIRLISSNVSRMEWRVSRRIDGYSTPDKEHPLYRLLNIEPNPLMGGMIWRESMLLDALLYGNAYAYIERDGMGNVIGLHKLRADAVEVSRGQDGFPIYTVMNSFNNRLGTVYQGFDIFHLRAPSLDGLLGETPIYLVRNIIGVELEAEKFVASFFRNGARPAGIIKVVAQKNGKIPTKNWLHKTITSVVSIGTGGGAGDDTFIFANGTTLTGTLNGLGGNNTLDFSA